MWLRILRKSALLLRVSFAKDRMSDTYSHRELQDYFVLFGLFVLSRRQLLQIQHLDFQRRSVK